MSMDGEEILLSIVGDASGVDEATTGATGAIEDLGGAVESVGATLEEVGAQIEAAFSGIADLMTQFATSVQSAMDNLSALGGAASDASGSVADLGGAADAAGGGLADVASAADLTTASLDSVSASADAAGTSLDGVGAKGAAAGAGLGAARAGTADMAGAMSTLGMPLLLTGAAVAGVGVASLKMAGDFQSGITTLKTGAGESQANLKLLHDGILQMSVDTGESQSQLVGGAFMIESANIRGKAALVALQAAAEGAKVGVSDLSTVADAETTLMTDFSSQHVSAANAVNSLIATVQNGKTHMQDLAQAIAAVAPTAAAAHIHLTDMMGALATMTGEGVPAANAATYLRQMITALQAPTKQTSDALAGLGLNANAVAAGMQTNLQATLQTITDALAKKFPDATSIVRAEMAKVSNGTESFDVALQNLSNSGAAGYVSALKQIAGGSKQMQGLLDLTGVHAQQFKSNVDAISSSVQQSGSTIKGWSDVQKDMNQQLSQGKEALAAAFTSLGEALMPLVTSLAKDLTPAIKDFGTFAQSHGPEIRAIFLGIASAVGALGGAFLIFGPGLKMFTALKTVSGVAGKMALKEFGALRGVFGDLAGVGMRAGDALLHMGNPLTLVSGLFGRLTSVVMGIPEALGGLFASISEGGGVIAILQGGLTGLWGAITAGLPALLPLAGGFLAVLGPILAIVGAVALVVIIFTKFHAQVMQVVGFIAGQLKPEFEDIQHTIATAMQSVKAQWDAVWPQLKPAVLDLINALKTLAPIFQVVFSVIGLVLKGVLGIVVGVVGGFISALPAIAAFFAALIRFLGDIGALVEAVFHGQWGKIPGIVGDMLKQVVLMVGSALAAVLGFVVNTVLNVIDWFNKMTGGALTPIENFVKGVIGFFTGLWDKLVGHSIVPDMITGIIGWFGKLPAQVAAHIRQMVQLALRGLDQLTGGGASKVIKFVATLDGKFLGLANSALKWGADMVGNLIHGLESKVGSLAHAASGVAGTIAKFLHFSVPEEGPLADADKWMGDFARTLTTSMAQQHSVIGAAASRMAGAVGSAFTGGLKGAISTSAGGLSGGLAGALPGRLVGAGAPALSGLAAAPAVAGGALYSGAGPLGSLSGGGNSAVLALLQQIARGVQQRPLGSVAPQSAALGSVTQQIGNINLNGIQNPTQFYALLASLGGQAFEDALRGATAGSPY